MSVIIPMEMKKIGRNDPCPCGSGKKYKQCCQDQENTASTQKRAEHQTYQQLAQSGIQYHQAGQLTQAETLYQQILQAQPDHAQILHYYGILLQAKGDLLTAIDHYHRAIAVKPEVAEVYSDLGSALQARGELKSALEHYQKAIKLKPRFPQAYFNLGTAQQAQGKYAEALECYRMAIQYRPDFAEAHNQMGLLWHAQGQAEQALSCYQLATKLKTDFAKAYNNWGNALKDLGRADEAVSMYQKAIALQPAYSNAYSNLGLAWQELGQFKEAIQAFRHVLALQPDFVEAHSNLLFTLNYDPDQSAEEIFNEHRRWYQYHALPIRQQPLKAARTSKQRRVRIGYVSPDFRLHPMRFFIEPILAHHDKTRFELFAYAQIAIEDPVTEKLKTYFDHWCNTVTLNDVALAEKIQYDGIDILVDLAGHTGNNRLLVFARRPAPIQVSFWPGYVYTTGLEAIDYFIADEYLTPVGYESLFSEKILRLPSLIAYRPPAGIVQPGTLPILATGQHDLQKITFGAVTRSVRINHRLIQVWAEILQRLPHARLLFNHVNFRNKTIQKNILDQFIAHGVASEKIIFASENPAWNILREIDITLDCFPQNSGTTLFESLYMGVPFITLADRPSVGRIGSAILHHLGRSEWIAINEAEYINKAIALAADINQLSLLRNNLRRELQASSLMNEASFTFALEQAYCAIIKQ